MTDNLYIIDLNDNVLKVSDLNTAIQQAELIVGFIPDPESILEVNSHKYWKDLLSRLNALKIL